ncbi:MAG TPA: hypothetical protein DHU55_00990 [Blastocatellia bacterium]|nr:hypothetical protein [Blastocatellia bacterium]
MIPLFFVKDRFISPPLALSAQGSDAIMRATNGPGMTPRKSTIAASTIRENALATARSPVVEQ